MYKTGLFYRKNVNLFRHKNEWHNYDTIQNIRQEENWGCWNEIFKTNGRIYTLGQKKSTDIREQLGIVNINDKLKQYEINWRERIQRIDNRLLKKNKITNLKGGEI